MGRSMKKDTICSWKRKERTTKNGSAAIKNCDHT
uniref:Uncharacterized protein n=1 Tax=Anguilla anguilla TaxID=7936 RepID=A0A0E9QYW4_ANGAN